MATEAITPDMEDTSQQQPLEGNPPEEQQVDQNDVLADREDLQEAVKTLAKHFIGLDKWVRRQEVIEARRQRFYWRNDQYIYWKSDAVGFVPAQGGQSVSLGDSEEELPRYTDVYNIYTPYGESLLSTLVQNPPGVNWQPEDPTKAEDVTASQTAEKYQQKIERDNDRKALQSEVGRLYYTDGRTILWTRRSNDFELITAHGVLETKVVPITAKSREELVAAFICEEQDVYKLKDEFENYADKIKEGAASLGESAYERIARLGVLQGTKMLMQAGDAFAHMVTKHSVFLRPSTFNKAEESLRDDLHDFFPNGCVATFCGGEYCGSRDASMDDELAISFPVPGDGMSRPSLGKRMVPLQDVFNDEINLWHEAHDYCIPTLFMYSETGDIDAIREQLSQPGNVIPFTALPPGATSASDSFFPAALEGIPATLPQFVQLLQGPLAEFISGAFPALFGGDTGKNDTAKGIAMQRDQAMGRMSIPWGHLQELFAEAYRQAVMCAVRYDNDEDTFTFFGQDTAGNPIGQSLSIADLKNGSFKCVPDTDSSFPDSTQAKRATLQTLMAASERNPILADVLAQPANQELMHEVLGVSDLVVPGAEARNKQLIEIDELLKESPAPPPMEKIQAAAMQNPQLLAQMAQWERANQISSLQGQPSTVPPPIPPDLMDPSIPVDKEFDFHEFELQTVKDWLSSPARRREEAKGNHLGIQNVRLHGMQHEKAIQEKAMQQALMAQGPQPSAPPKKPVGKEAASTILNTKAAATPQPASAGAPPQPAAPQVH